MNQRRVLAIQVASEDVSILNLGLEADISYCHTFEEAKDLLGAGQFDELIVCDKSPHVTLDFLTHLSVRLPLLLLTSEDEPIAKERYAKIDKLTIITLPGDQSAPPIPKVPQNLRDPAAVEKWLSDVKGFDNWATQIDSTISSSKVLPPKPRRKMPVALVLLLVILVGAFFGERIVFLLRAKAINGRVISVESKNTMCGNFQTQCTAFTAKIGYTLASGQSYSVYDTRWLAGYDRPAETAPLKVGQSVEMRYDPSLPSYAIENSFAGRWACVLFPAILLAILLAYYRWSWFKSLLDLKWW